MTFLRRHNIVDAFSWQCPSPANVRLIYSYGTPHQRSPKQDRRRLLTALMLASHTMRVRLVCEAMQAHWQTTKFSDRRFQNPNGGLWIFLVGDSLTFCSSHSDWSESSAFVHILPVPPPCYEEVSSKVGGNLLNNNVFIIRLLPAAPKVRNCIDPVASIADVCLCADDHLPHPDYGLPCGQNHLASAIHILTAITFRHLSSLVPKRGDVFFALYGKDGDQTVRHTASASQEKILQRQAVPPKDKQSYQGPGTPQSLGHAYSTLIASQLESSKTLFGSRKGADLQRAKGRPSQFRPASVAMAPFRISFYMMATDLRCLDPLKLIGVRRWTWWHRSYVRVTAFTTVCIHFAVLIV